MLCQTAFGKNSPPNDFKELVVQVAKLAYNLPLGLSILGSSLRKRGEKEWMKIMPQLQNDLDEKIEKPLRIRFDRLSEKDRELFLYVACFFNGCRVRYIEDFLCNNVGLKPLIDKSLVRITPQGYIEMHNFVEKLGIKIDRAESKGNPGKSRFLKNAEEILEVFTHKTGTETVVGIFFKASELSNEFISIDGDSFKGMANLQFLKIHNYSLWSSTETCIVHLPYGLDYWPRKLKWLEWNSFPLKYLPRSFNTDHLVELSMENSKLTRLWDGTQPLGSLKKMDLSRSKYLKEVPNLSKAINLEELDLHGCISLVKLPRSIQVTIKLRKLNMRGCIELKSFPTHLKLKSLHDLDLTFCHNLTNFPVIKMENSIHMPYEVEIRVDDCLWNRNLYDTMWNRDLHGLDYLGCLKRCLPCEFRPEYLVRLVVIGNKKLEKLWEGVQSLGSLIEIDLSECTKLREVPDLFKAINLRSLKLNKCESLVTLPSTIGNLKFLERLEMRGCILLEVLPTDVTLLSLEILDLSGCLRLRNFSSDSMEYRKALFRKHARHSRISLLH
ncbi:hypothetical protein CARUB_v10004233mg [Capsella rubella]|uniref:Disease resistance protein Roq1-like winged-helix domain-containing protein n=1 Tax=Capsella rubella TaxID=81985 RepID=R0F3Z2_9BRAS|nr:hypothetical protein CARUB_v10004233mg [Capsella rubella]